MTPPLPMVRVVFIFFAELKYGAIRRQAYVLPCECTSMYTSVGKAAPFLSCLHLNSAMVEILRNTLLLFRAHAVTYVYVRSLVGARNALSCLHLNSATGEYGAIRRHAYVLPWLPASLSDKNTKKKIRP